MMSDRTIARVVGVLFILASVAAIAGGSLIIPLDDPDYLAEASANGAQIVSGVLIEVILVLSVVGIGVMFYPVLKRRNEALALGYAGARTMESVALLAASMSALVVFSVSDGSASAVGAQTVGDSFLAMRDWTYLVGSMVLLGVSAMLLNTLLYRARLVPAWISLWGMAGGLLILARGIVEMYGWEPSGLAQGLLAAPIAVQEMVLALWLILRGFDTSRLGVTGTSTIGQTREKELV